LNWVKKVMTFAILSLWLGAANHCLLEEFPALKFLACAPHGETEPHQDNDCNNDSCATVEKATYKTETGRVTAPNPFLLLAQHLLAPIFEEGQEFFSAGSAGPISALELAAAWQFSYRTASPPRAPSFLS